MRDYAPLRMFGIVAALLLAMSIVLFIPVLMFFLENRIVPRIPTFISSLTLFTLAAISFLIGFAMQSITAARQQMFMSAYQAIGSVRPIRARGPD